MEKTSLRYRMINGLVRVLRVRNAMARDAGTGRHRNARPSGKQKSRWRKDTFNGRTVWSCKPEIPDTGRVYIHQHGGGYVYGIQHGHFQSCTELSDLAGVTVIMPDYPLPPEATAAEIFVWADSHFTACAERYGLDALSMGGDSAGGHLTLAILQKRLARGDANPERIILMSPWLDMTQRETPPTKADDFEPLISPFSLEPAVKAFIGGMDREDPLISPIKAELNDLPAMDIITGEKDILFKEIEKFATRARAAGKLASYQAEPQYGHWWMFYPTPDRHPTLRHVAELLKS